MCPGIPIIPRAGPIAAYITIPEFPGIPIIPRAGPMAAEITLFSDGRLMTSSDAGLVSENLN